MNRWLKRVIVRLKDRLRYAKLLQWGMGMLCVFRARGARSLAQRLDRFAQAYRHLAPLNRDGAVKQVLAPYVVDAEKVRVWRDEKIGWRDKTAAIDAFEISKGLILKPFVSSEEKGVILISFEYNWLPLLTLSRASALFERYMLICAPSWSPPPFPAIWGMAGVPNGDVFVMQSNFAEQDWYDRLPTNVEVLPLLISHWIHPDYYQPRPHQERDIDILMVANWATFKRQWVLFDALKALPESYRIVLVGQPDSGRTLKDVEAEAEAFGARGRIEFRERLSISEVTDLQCRSKVSLMLSRREGSCVVVAESMFADAPVGLLEGAHIGSSAFINPQTGVFLNEARLGEELRRFVEQSESFSAREWARKEISCFRSAEILNRALRDWSQENGRDWTQDVVPFMCRPNPAYTDEATGKVMSAAYRDLSDCCGTTIAGF